MSDVYETITEVPSFGKVWALGNRMVSGILSEDVRVTEKIDGSQFTFGRTMTGELVCRSKGRMIDLNEGNQGLFSRSIAWVHSIEDKIPAGFLFYGEAMRGKLHNKQDYWRAPPPVVLFGIREWVYGSWQPNGRYAALKAWADRFHLDAVTEFDLPKPWTEEALVELANTAISNYGGPVEGIVITNKRTLEAAKVVSNGFREVVGKKKNVVKPKVADIFEQYNTEARWDKAVQYHREIGKLTDTPGDIGPLVKQIQQDVHEECKQELMELLYAFYRKDINQAVIQGFPDYYKGKC